MEKSKDDKEREVDSTDSEGNPVKVIVRKPTPQNYRDSQIAYNQAFRKALDSGAFIRQKLNDYMVDEEIWDEAKEEEYRELLDDMDKCEQVIKGGGIRVSEAKKLSLELREKRLKFRVLLEERNALDANSAEGQADNARFSALVRLCIFDPTNNKPYFDTGKPAEDEKTYDAQADQPWVVEAAAELANMIYGLDPNYDKNLPENEFLREWKFINDKLDFINKDGHPVDSEGRLVDENNRYIAYHNDEAYKNRDAEQSYFINIDGDKVDKDGEKLGKKAFLDDDDNPISPPGEAKAEEDANKSKPAKKKGRTPKADTKTT